MRPRLDTMGRRQFLQAGVAAATAAALPAGAAPPPLDLDEVTIAELHAGMRTGEITARVATEKYLARIDAIDRQGPALRSVIEVNPDALAQADALDREQKAT